jgi:uncharacterized YigZ family protein
VQDSYKTIKSPGEGFYKDKGSKFYAYVYPVQSEEEIKEILVSIKKEHHSARHHCYAWKLGKEKVIYRYNDNGEPSSTAGKPIFRQLQKYDVTNVLMVVVRYFGGTLLGTSGLINAYRAAAADALENAEIIVNIIEIFYRLTYSYNEMNTVMRTINQENLNIINTHFEADCKVDISLPISQSTRVEKIFSQIEGVEIKKI